MSELKKILFRLGLAAILVLVLQYISAYFLWPYYNPQLKEITQNILKGDVVFFSDSSNANIAPTDGSHTESVSQTLANNLNGKRLVTVAEPAYHLQVFEAFTQYISHQVHHPKLLIYAINLRSFSSEYYLRPAYRFPAIRSELVHGPTFFRAFIRPLHIFGAKYDGVDFPHDTFPVTHNGKVIGLVKDLDRFKGKDDLSQEEKKLWVSYVYGYPLEDSHPLLESIHNIIEQNKKTGSLSYFYFMPIDIQAGTEWYGKDFSSMLNTRADFISKKIRSQGALCSDYSQLLPKTMYFNHSRVIAEHLTYMGRNVIGKKVAEEVNRILEKDSASKVAITEKARLPDSIPVSGLKSH